MERFKIAKRFLLMGILFVAAATLFSSCEILPDEPDDPNEVYYQREK